MSNFSTLSVRGCWGQPMLLFWKLVDETQISKPPEPTRHHNSIKLWILLPLRADLLYILQYETPCITWQQRVDFSFSFKNKIYFYLIQISFGSWQTFFIFYCDFWYVLFTNTCRFFQIAYEGDFFILIYCHSKKLIS